MLIYQVLQSGVVLETTGFPNTWFSSLVIELLGETQNNDISQHPLQLTVASD